MELRVQDGRIVVALAVEADVMAWLIRSDRRLTVVSHGLSSNINLASCGPIPPSTTFETRKRLVVIRKRQVDGPS